MLWFSLFRVGFPLFHGGWWLLIFCWIWNIHFPLVRVEISKFFSGCLNSQVLRNYQYLWNVVDFCHIKFCLWTHLSAIMWKEHTKYSFIAYFGLTKKKWFSPLCLLLSIWILVIILNWESLAHGRKEFDCLPKHSCVEFLDFSPIVFAGCSAKGACAIFWRFCKNQRCLGCWRCSQNSLMLLGHLVLSNR